MTRLNEQQVLVVTSNAHDRAILLAYGKAAAAARGGLMAHARLRPDECFWPELRRIAAAWPGVLIVVRWPDDSRQTRNIMEVAAWADVLAVDHRGYAPADIRRIVAPWSGNPNSLERLRLASRLAGELGVPGHVLRVVSTEGIDTGDGSDRQAQARYLRQVRRRDRIELALAGVSLETRFAPGADAVGDMLHRLGKADLVLMGPPSDWFARHRSSASITQDIRSSASGPCAVLVSSSPAPISLSDVFQERAILIRPVGGPSSVSEMVELLVSQRQIPWRLKPLITERAKAIGLGRRARLVHAQIPQDGRVIGSITLSIGVLAPDPRIAFLLLVPQQGYATYLPVLAKLAEFASDQERLDALLRCRTPAEVMAAFRPAAREPALVAG